MTRPIRVIELRREKKTLDAWRDQLTPSNPNKLTADQIAGRERCPAPSVPCSQCDGDGFVKLEQPYARTYYLASTGWESTDLQLSRHRDGVKRTALLNRLNKLVELGLVERRNVRGSMTMLEWRRNRPIREQAADLCSAMASAWADSEGHIPSGLRWSIEACELAFRTGYQVRDEFRHDDDMTLADLWAEAECRLRERSES